jgi:hypothetical protein
MKQERHDKSAAIDMLMEMILDSEAPEDMKIDFKLMKARNELVATANALLEELTLSGDKYTTEQKTGALEYLSLVMSGIKQYISEITKQTN